MPTDDTDPRGDAPGCPGEHGEVCPCADPCIDDRQAVAAKIREVQAVLLEAPALIELGPAGATLADLDAAAEAGNPYGGDPAGDVCQRAWRMLDDLAPALTAAPPAPPRSPLHQFAVDLMYLSAGRGPQEVQRDAR